MNSAELIVALHADTKSALAKNICFIERHEPCYLNKIEDALQKRRYFELVNIVFTKANELRVTT